MPFNADADSSRAEIWAPIWDRRTTYGELTVLLREGRAAVDSRGGARQPEEDDGIAGIRVPEQELRHESYVSGLCEAVHLRFEGNADREDGPWSEFE
jgi:hypothetical protein